MRKEEIHKDTVVIRFAGDSGDGMQLSGIHFSNSSAIAGNAIATLPDYPSEIRAPAGTQAGVSGYQIQFADHQVLTPGDQADVLVAMNPAAVLANLDYLKSDSLIILNEDGFGERDFKKAKVTVEQFEENIRNRFKTVEVPLTTLTREALADCDGLTKKEQDRCKNVFALGLTFWMFDRPGEALLAWLDEKFDSRPQLLVANRKAYLAGYYYGETTELFKQQYIVRKSEQEPGHYRKITGNDALALGLVTAARKADKPLVYSGYPITPASDILHALARLKGFDVRTFQAEDEIASMGATVGAAFAGSFAATASSGPGIALKSEALNLGVALELPMVVVNVQRGGPSTGLPTKTEQSDLLMMFFGRNGESPIPILAPAKPSECFWLAIEAFRIAVDLMTPVVLLSDGYLANSAEPWKIPDLAKIRPLVVRHPLNDEHFLPYERTATGGRPWAIPGTYGLEHRIGGLAKAPKTGNVSYAPEDHAVMTSERQAKIDRLAERIPKQPVFGSNSGELLIVSWGGTFGSVRTAAEELQKEGHEVAHAHVRYLNPLPSNFQTLLHNYKKIVVCELNGGQLSFLIQGRFGIPVESITKVKGRPFQVQELKRTLTPLLRND